MTVTVTTSCSKENCVELAQDVLDKVEFDDVAGCNEYKTAQQKFINNCLSGEAQDAAQAALDELACVD